MMEIFKKIRARFLLAIFMVAVTLVACGSGKKADALDVSEPEPSAPHSDGLSNAGNVSVASPYSTFDLSACLEIARGDVSAAEDLCLGIITAGLVGTIEICAGVGGELAPMRQPSLQSLDVNGDGQSEFLYDVTENYQCDGAPSVLSCGSLGCPVLLLEEHDGAWNTIGLLNTGDAVAAEVLLPEPGMQYGTLRGGCAGERPCEEMTYYVRDGSAYLETMIDANGQWVDIAPAGLWTLIDETAVLASPSPGAVVLQRYPAGTEVAVIGDARGAPYKYVSPCNACKSGFVDSTALRKASWN